MIIANIIKEKWKGGRNRKVRGIDIIIANISLEKNNGFSLKCWQKICTKFCKLSVKNAFFFSASEGKFPSDTPIFSMAKNV